MSNLTYAIFKCFAPLKMSVERNVAVPNAKRPGTRNSFNRGKGQVSVSDREEVGVPKKGRLEDLNLAERKKDA
jgi:hypothetical protein